MESPGEVVLKDLIQYYCSNFLYENAKFFAERLYYGNPNSDQKLKSEYLFLLAKCYHGQGKTRQVYHLLKEDTYLPNRYLFAKSCIDLSKYPEAEKALFPLKNIHPNEITESDLAFIPGGAAGLYLLGVICRREQRKDYAIAYFQQTIKFDKNCWVALCALSEMGIAIDTEALFGVDMTSALEGVRASQEPIASAHSLPATTSANTRREREADTHYSRSHGHSHRHRQEGAGAGAGAGAGEDALKFQRGHVMERRHIAEHLGDPHHTPPNSAMSLGLSSLALRVGFATPGCMPTPPPEHDNNHDPYSYRGSHMQQFIAEGGGGGEGGEGEMHSFSNYSNTAPLSAMGGGCGGGGESNGYRTVTRTSDRHHGSGGGGNNLFSSPDSLLHMSINSHDQRQGQRHDEHPPSAGPPPAAGRPGLLFDTPGLTPIAAGRRSMDGGHGGGELSMHTSTYPMSLERDMSDMRGRRESNNSSGLSLPPPPSELEDEDEQRELQLHGHARGGGGGGEEGRRRVSFDPSTLALESPPLLPPHGEGQGGKQKKIAARLSFSSAGKEDVGVRSDHAPPPEKFQRLKDSHDTEEFDFSTPGGGLQIQGQGPQGQGQGQGSSLSSPREVAQELYNRVQQHGQNHSQSQSQQPLTPAAGPGSVSGHVHVPLQSKAARTLGKASRIPIPISAPNRSSRGPPLMSAAGAGAGGTARGNENMNVDVNVHVTPAVKTPGPPSSRQAAGRGAGAGAGAGRHLESAGLRGTGQDQDQEQRDEQQEQERRLQHQHQQQQYQECWQAGQTLVFSILSVFSHAYHLLCQYQCTECIRHLQLLPRRHYSCGWVQHTLGRAYFELNDYKAAQLALQEMLRLEPFRVKGAEILSTALWHLKREKELCALSQQVAEIDKLSPETWCVVGNCFSLQKEHDTALKFFSRSIQIDPSFTYAHTLSGHEYICNEDLDKAQASFRDAIFHDERHYNAWYGLGTIYLRQERIELAEYHFKRAIAVHPTSSVLQTYLGMVLNAYDRLDKNTEAIEVLQRACQYDSRNSMLFFQLAHVLLKHGSREHLLAALRALHVVREHAPKEPPVYSTLGEVCHKLGRNQEALKYFNTAINLDHKQAAVLKPILDAIQDPYLSNSHPN